MNKTVLITGASGGIGAATAEAFAHSGYQTAVAYYHGGTRAAALCERLTAEGCSALPFCADLSDRAAAFALIGEVTHACGGL
ncbi:MAG: SDR family NAD(P)-dependent oxidoreductase, partial [Pygmaiobacter sp.]